MDSSLNTATATSSNEDAAEALPRPIRWLSWFNLLTGCMTLVPCCFGVYLPCVSQVIIYLHMRRLFENAPDGSRFSILDLMVVPLVAAYGGQIVLLGIPSIFAAVLLRRNVALGWQLSVVLVVVQGLLLCANLMALIVWGHEAWRPFDWPTTAGLFAAEVVLLVTSALFVVQAGRVRLTKRGAEAP